MGTTRTFRSLALASLTLVVGAGLAACGSGSGGDSGADGGRTVVVENSFDLKTADPGRVYEITGGMITHAMYEPLLGFDGGDLSKPIPVIAKSYELSADGKTLKLPLRENVKFSDGTALTAADVVFSYNRVKNLKGNPSFLLDGVTPSAPDPHTVVLTSERSNPALPYLLAAPSLGIQNSKVVKKHGGSDATDADKTDTAEKWLDSNSAGSGPYVLKSFSTTSEVVLVKNTKYWGANKPTYDKVVVRNVTGDVQKLNVQKGESQLALDLSPQQAEGLPDSVVVKRNPTTTSVFLFANDNPAISKVTSNPDFQTAVRYGLDYKALLELAGNGAVRAPGIIPTPLIGALDPAKAPQADLNKAKAALAASGYKGEKVELEYPSDVTKNGVSFGTVAQRVQAQLKTVGINVTLNPSPVATALPNYRDGKEQLGLWFWGADYPDPSDYLAFLPGEIVGLRAGWSADANPALSALADQAATTIDTEARGAIYEKIQEKMNAEGPFMPLFQTAQIAVTAKSLTGFVYNPTWTVDFAALK